MVGVPVTYEHLGIMDVADGMDSIETLTAANVATALATTDTPAHRQIGEVVHAWEMPDGEFAALLEIDPHLRGLQWLITSKQLSACSLTHVIAVNGCDVVPLEVSLVGSPARPGCKVVNIAVGQFAATAYKARSFLDGKAAYTMATLIEKTEEAVKQLPPDSQKLIMAKFGALVESLAAEKRKSASAENLRVIAEQNLNTAETLHKTQQIRSDCDLGLLGAQITQMCNRIDPEVLEGFHINLKDTISDVQSDNPKVITNGLGRLILCANSILMAQHKQPIATTPQPHAAAASEVAGAAKRRRVEPEIPSEPLSDEAALRFALSSVFE